MPLSARCLNPSELGWLAGLEAGAELGDHEVDLVRCALVELAHLRSRVGHGYQPPPEWRVVSGDSHADWLAARQRYLTASDVAAVLGLNPYKSAAAAIREKAFPGPEKRSSPAMLMGQFLEEGVVQGYNAIHGKSAVRVRSASGASVLVAHPTIPGLAASMDAVDLDADGRPREVVEVKVTSKLDGYNWTVARVQLQVQLGCAELDRGVVVVCAGSKPDVSKELRRPAFHAKLPGLVEKFWRDVEACRAKGKDVKHG